MGIPGKTKTEATKFDSWTVEVGFLVHNYLNQYRDMGRACGMAGGDCGPTCTFPKKHRREFWRSGQTCVCSSRGTVYAVEGYDAKVQEHTLTSGWSGATA